MTSLNAKTPGASRWESEATRSRRLFDRARSVMPGGNTRTTVFTSPHPIYARSGSGCRVTDVDGNVRLDFVNNYTALIHGHGHVGITAAVTSQLTLGTCFAMPTEAEIALAELICERVASIERIRFTNSGTEAVMMAVKAARAFTGRHRIAKAEGAYHGSYDYVEVSEDSAPEEWGDDDAPSAFPYSEGISPTVLTETVVFPFNDMAGTEGTIRRHADELAAVIIDPLPPRLGLIPATSAWLGLVRHLCNEFGIVLISDEIISFRLAAGGAQASFGFSADLTTLGKIIGGGFPVGAVGGRAEIMAVFDPTGGKPRVPHGGTFNANPITMVAGVAAIEALREGSFAKLDALGDRVARGIERAFAQSGLEGQVSGRGSLRRIHMTSVHLSDYRSAYPSAGQREQMAQLFRRLLDKGVMVTPTGLIAISTAMTEADIDQLIRAVEESLAA
jgi:glutamate-1-semialdehyde 2,1-aminomutase